MSEYEFSDLPNFNVERLMKSIGDKIKSNNEVFLSSWTFNVLASENPLVVTKTINELNKHAELMDLLV
jgi:UV DNA damage repair endonuclease